jgi:DNA-binding LacI/PurR family transcriptional regulator
MVDASPPKPPARVQMADLARIAGVSKATVSRALSDSPLINKETRDRIQQLARDHSYAVNLGARNLRLQRNQTIAVVVPYESQAHQQLSDPFFLSMIGALADALVSRGYDMLLTRIDAAELERSADMVHSGRAMGLVLIGQWHHHDRLNAMVAGGLPMVVWGADMGALQSYTSVGGDNLLGGKLATEHLLAQGRSRIVFIGDPVLPEVGQRWQGHCEALAQAGLHPEEALALRVPFDTLQAAQALRELCERGHRFDAVQACSDLLALTAIQVLRARGFRVPQDVAVIGYDDMPVAALSNPPLSSIHQPVPQAGEALVESLLALLDGKAAPHRTLPVHLVERRSSVLQSL